MGPRPQIHSWRIFHTVVSEPSPELPWHRYVGYVNDQVVFEYNSEKQRVEPRTPWMAQNEDSEFWDHQIWWARRWQAWFRGSLNTLRELYNRTEGFHIIQMILGCDLREDNTTWGFYQDSYNERDFLTFDKETMTWVAADIGAQITKRRWDAEVFDNQRWKHYLEEECIPWLRSFLEYGKETLQRKVHPTARVSDRSSHDGLTTLSCKVSGFYPRDITVTWLKNGESRQQDTYSEGILPSGDGTYQTWVTMEIDPKIKAHYSCHVEHESLLEPLSVSWGKADQPGSLWQTRADASERDAHFGCKVSKGWRIYHIPRKAQIRPLFPDRIGLASASSPFSTSAGSQKHGSGGPSFLPMWPEVEV
uniref:Ig-like domain-containing protein n=1 Tax=Chelydra serpentina TaxID=8475 RepID=A0A8C3SLH0_CHESE